jgi:taurine transport system substrate-binding protein
LTGADPNDVPEVLSQYHFPSLAEQVSETWLGGGAADSLRDTSVFLAEQKKIPEALADYRPLLEPRFARAALEAHEASNSAEAVGGDTGEETPLP